MTAKASTSKVCCVLSPCCERSSAISRMGPNSPTTPSATTTRPKKLSICPESRSIGIRMPSAVVDNAIASTCQASTSPSQ